MSGYMNRFLAEIYIHVFADLFRIILRYHVHDH